MMITQAHLLHCSSPNHGRQHPLPTIAPFLGHPSGELSYWFHINFSSLPSFLSFYKRSKQSNADFLNWRQTLLLRSYSPTSCLDTRGRTWQVTYSWHPWGFFSMKDIITTVVYSICLGCSPTNSWRMNECREEDSFWDRSKVFIFHLPIMEGHGLLLGLCQ